MSRKRTKQIEANLPTRLRTRLLSEQEFKTTMSRGMQDVTETATDVLDIWPYVASVPPADLESHLVSNNLVEVVYRNKEHSFDHVLVVTKTKNVYLSVVVDLDNDTVYGHRLLDLNREYGYPERNEIDGSPREH